MKTERAIGVIFFCIKNKKVNYLILKYNNLHGQNHYDFVKGKPKVNESTDECINREVFEEIGIRNFSIVSDFKISNSYNYIKNDGIEIFKEIEFFISELNTNVKVKLSSEHSEFKWVDFKEAEKLLEFEGQRHILIKVDEYLNNLFRKKIGQK